MDRAAPPEPDPAAPRPRRSGGRGKPGTPPDMSPPDPGAGPAGGELLVIDGFSLLHRDPGSVALLRRGRAYPARRRLVERLEHAAGRLADRMVIVFDGRAEGGAAEDFAASSVEVRYSAAGESADLVIERMAVSAARPERMLVVSSDRLVRQGVEAAGARHMGCGEFLDRLRRLHDELSRAAGRAGGRAPPPRLGDRFPDAPPGRAAK